jgi:dTDP-4-dehydrorhamnose reductase|tara:strand:- start:1196 stop:2047 length:852 start_codon:yes stop_codon:yes gene_type:complete
MNYQSNQKLFCITGSSGHLGSELIKLFEEKKIKFIKFKIPRPTKTDKNLKSFYSKHINEFLILNKHVNTIINCAASLKPKNHKEFYFNSYFPILFQESLFKLNEHSIFINISSTRIFKNSTDKYSLSKKNSEKIMFKKGKVVSIYPDIILDKTKGSYNELENILSSKIPFVPVFNPGNYFYPISCSSLAEKILKISLDKVENKKKIIICGNRKISFYEIVDEINNKNKKKIILSIPSKYFNLFPPFIKNFFYKSYYLQKFEDSNFLNHINKNDYDIIHTDFKL